MEKKNKPGVHVIEGKATIFQDMPEKVAKILEKEKIKIKIDKVVIDKLFDQTHGVADRDGCYSTPSGPSC